jgi:hypothetical protein
MESIVGRRAAPSGVERKSEGRSGMIIWLDAECKERRIVPLINDGIDPPVRNPIQSLVNELQLKSAKVKQVMIFIRDTSFNDPT